MRKNLCTRALAAGLVFLCSCPARAGSNEFWGTGVGVALGGFLGSSIGRGSGQLAATGAGVFLGGMMGNSVGRSLDRADSASYYRGGGATYYGPSYPIYRQNYVAAPMPQPVYQPVEVYTSKPAVYVDQSFVGPPSPLPCRTFTQIITIGGEPYESFGRACLRPDGSWQIVSQ